MKMRTGRIMPPPISKLNEAARQFIGSARFINLGQGMPGHIPPQTSLDSLADMLSHPTIHRYTSDPGLIELREELSLFLRRMFNIIADPLTEVIITAGGNNAFSGVALTLLGPGDNIVMPSPFYFNFAMAAQLCGAEVRTTPVDERFQPVPERIIDAIDENTRAVLLVTPNNPTGAVYERSIIDTIVDTCIDHDIALISDETYAQMVFDHKQHYSPRSRKDARDNVITIGSFSKNFGMSGWRIGYVIGPEDFMDELLKIQDSFVICAPTASQILALDILKNSMDHVQLEIERISHLRELAYVRIKEIDALETFRTAGTFYIFPRVKDCEDSNTLVLDLLISTEILVLPGRIFGEQGEGHIRISFGPLTPDAVDEAFDRLKRFFDHRS